MMRSIGGGIAHQFRYHFAYTDSGRSSLKLILNQNLADRVWWIPDFICTSVLDVFEKMGVCYKFYHVYHDLTWHFPEGLAEGDIFYRVHYFGALRKQAVDLLKKSQVVVVDDFVFLADCENVDDFSHWYGFNSYRKISYLADGSLLCSNQALDLKIIHEKASPFSEIKYQAKALKAKYFEGQTMSEDEYLELFVKGEQMLDQQTDIFRMSNASQSLLETFRQNYHEDLKRRKQNFHLVHKYLRLPPVVVPDFPCFYVIDVNTIRDKLRQHLFEHQVYLPVHWPSSEIHEHLLSQRLLSIPLDPYYNAWEFRKVIKLINRFI